MWDKIQDRMEEASNSGRTLCKVPIWDTNKQDREYLKDLGIKIEVDRAGYLILDWSH